MNNPLYNLRNDGDPTTQIVQSDLGDVDPVNLDVSTGGLDDAEDAESQGRLPRSGPTYDSNLQRQRIDIYIAVFLLLLLLVPMIMTMIIMAHTQDT